MTYIVEYEDLSLPPFHRPIIEQFDTKAAAMRRARGVSKKTDTPLAYVLDEKRTGHMAYYGGAFDHRDGAHI